MPSEEEMSGPSGSGTVSHNAVGDASSRISANMAIAELVDQIQAMLTADTVRLLASLNDAVDTGLLPESDGKGLSFHASLSSVSGHRAWHLDMFWRCPVGQPVSVARHSVKWVEGSACVSALSAATACAGGHGLDKG